MINLLPTNSETLNRDGSLQNTNTCITLNKNPTPSWCGLVTPQGHETVYLSESQTTSLGVGTHTITVDESITFDFVIEQPTLDIIEFTNPSSINSDLTVHLSTTSINQNNPYDYCILLDFIPFFFPPTTSISFKNLPLKPKTLINTAIIDQESRKVIWFGKIFNYESDFNSGGSIFETYIETEEAPPPKKPTTLKQKLEYRPYGLYSQNTEDSILLYIFYHHLNISELSDIKYLEFGAENGREVNTRIFRELGAKGALFDR